ncbi:uncharacterized protein LOC123384115 [Felis catus]|uniref:uncharacterized protein LOC123384115 n=1 Tax=Felis catus TaxID=9685 RepID=UPI001D19B752|nr:uncharacterized protein LOC123384115 [Felis catus]XP_044909110.1 uncharacterized protein LOC123384115 [Felis catus]XP_044909111.1 uncharacterized protein LOC123384115 [Felis catus]XP_044909112.1 uncharacterized protein LOC123384115 [Felis catus]
MSELVQVLWFSRRFLTRAAESQVTSPSAEDEVARGTIERLVPLVPDTEVAPAEVRRGRSGRGRVPDPRALAGLFRGGPQSGCTPPSPRQHYHAAQLSQLPVPRSLLHPAHAGAHLGEEAAEEQPEDATNHVSQPGLRRPPLQARTKLPRLLPGGCEPPPATQEGRGEGRSWWAAPALGSARFHLPDAGVARLRGGARWGGARLAGLREDQRGQALGAGPAPYREKRGPQSSGEWVGPCLA